MRTLRRGGLWHARLRPLACTATMCVGTQPSCNPTMSTKPDYPTIEDAIGHTPLVRLQRVPGAANAQRGNVILAKLEGNNPAGSVIDRPAISMIRRAEERGDIKPGDT